MNSVHITSYYGSKKLLSSFLLNVQCTSLECVLDLDLGLVAMKKASTRGEARLRRWMKRQLFQKLQIYGWH